MSLVRAQEVGVGAGAGPKRAGRIMSFHLSKGSHSSQKVFRSGPLTCFANHGTAV